MVFMWKAVAFAMVAVTMAAVVAQAADPSCAGLQQSFYCLDDERYAWCYGQDTPSVGKCPASLVCKCGRTTSNPCGWFALASPCAISKNE